MTERLAAAAREYIAATEALHTTHPTTNVHEREGSFYGAAAITDHCAWECHVMDAVYDSNTHTIIGNGAPIHEAVMDRWRLARVELDEALEDANG